MDRCRGGVPLWIGRKLLWFLRCRSSGVTVTMCIIVSHGVLSKCTEYVHMISVVFVQLWGFASRVCLNAGPLDSLRSHCLARHSVGEQGEKGSSALLCCGFSVQGKTNFSRVSSFLCKGGKCNHLSSKFTDVDRLFIHLLSAWIHFRKDETASWEDANRYWKQGKSGQTSLFWSALVYCYKCCFNQNLLLCVQFCGPGVTGKQSFVN